MVGLGGSCACAGLSHQSSAGPVHVASGCITAAAGCSSDHHASQLGYRKTVARRRIAGGVVAPGGA